MQPRKSKKYLPGIKSAFWRIAFSIFAAWLICPPNATAQILDSAREFYSNARLSKLPNYLVISTNNRDTEQDFVIDKVKLLKSSSSFLKSSPTTFIRWSYFPLGSPNMPFGKHGNLGVYGNSTPLLDFPDYYYEIIDAGPSAIQQLVSLIGDPTPVVPNCLATDFAIDCNTIRIRKNKLPLNHANVGETRFFWDKASSSKSNIPSLSVEKIDITIGDIAFVLLGQIVNRPYSFHQTDVWEDGVVSVVTISRQEVLSIAVRDYWSRDSISQQLLDSLVIDFCTRPVFHYGLPFGNHDSMPKKHALRLSDFPCVDPYTIQIGATARLIAFYPQESRDLIISRIKELTLTEWETLHIDNEIHVLDFLFECSKSKDQKILDAIKELYQRDKKNILKLDSHIPHLFQDPKQS